jgi:hypothetical protein
MLMCALETPSCSARGPLEYASASFCMRMVGTDSLLRSRLTHTMSSVPGSSVSTPLRDLSQIVTRRAWRT